MNAKENFDVTTYRSTEEVMLQSGDTVWGIAKRALQTANVPHDDQTINQLCRTRPHSHSFGCPRGVQRL